MARTHSQIASFAQAVIFLHRNWSLQSSYFLRKNHSQTWLQLWRQRKQQRLQLLAIIQSTIHIVVLEQKRMASDLKSPGMCMQDTEMPDMTERVLRHGLSTVQNNLMLRTDFSDRASNGPQSVEYDTKSDYSFEYAKCSCHFTIASLGKLRW